MKSPSVSASEALQVGRFGFMHASPATGWYRASFFIASVHAKNETDNLSSQDSLFQDSVPCTGVYKPDSTTRYLVGSSGGGGKTVGEMSISVEKPGEEEEEEKAERRRGSVVFQYRHSGRRREHKVYILRQTLLSTGSTILI
jgi:hypothetical protein